MNARIRKEVRALLPFWGFGLAAAALGGLVANQYYQQVWMFVVWGSLAGLAVTTFGTEFTHQTLGQFFSQPIGRQRLWGEKVGVLGCALASVTLVYLLIFFLSRAALPPDQIRTFVWAVCLFALCALGGGMGFTMALRHVHGAFWLTLLTPWFVGMAAEYYRQKLLPNSSEETWIAAALILYSILGGLLGWWRFLTLQDTAVLSRNFSLGLEQFLVWPFRQPRSTWGALVGKEVVLQQISWTFALCVLVMLALSPAWEHLVKPGNAGIISAVKVFLFGILICLVPLMIGATAIAEERKLGLLEWQQTLPVSRCRQWTLKLGVGLVLTLILAWVGPAVVTACVFRRDADYPFSRFPDLEVAMLIPLCLFGAGLWASSIAGNTLQALVTGAALALTTLACHLEPLGFPSVARSRLFAAAGWPLLVLIALRLSYVNYQSGQILLRNWLRNLGIFTAWFVTLLLVATAIYHRAWEKFLPEPEPSLGLALPQRTEPRLRLVFGNGVFLMPDGSLWLWNNFWPQRVLVSDQVKPGVLFRKSVRTNWVAADGSYSHTFTIEPTSTPLYRMSAETNWVAVTGGSSYGLALKEPGTLWAWGLNQSGQLGVGGERRDTHRAVSFEPLQQVGRDSDLVAVETGFSHTLALKRDGSLWAWGSNQNGQLGIPGIGEAFEPKRVDSSHDWVSIAAFANGSVAVKKDGTLWRWGNYAFSKSAKEPEPVGTGANWARVAEMAGASTYLVQRNDGTWWAGDPPFWLESRRNAPADRFGPVPMRLDFAVKTLSIDFVNSLADFSSALAIKPDGSLWEWRPISLRGSSHFFNVKHVRIGKRNDWLAITTFNGTRIGLTADGWLWMWGRPTGANSDNSAEQWLSYSQRPKRFFNVITRQAL